MRDALARGDLNQVHSYLGRPHRVFAETEFNTISRLDSNGNFIIPLDQCLNQTPGMGSYSVTLEVNPSANGNETGQDTVTVVPLSREVVIRDKDLQIQGFDLDLKPATRVRLMIQF